MRRSVVRPKLVSNGRTSGIWISRSVAWHNRMKLNVYFAWLALQLT
jgi:hypothetical protein